MLDGQVPHWTGTHGEMISSDLHGAEEPTRWMLRPQQGAETGQRGLHQEKRRTFHRGTSVEPYLGGLSPLHKNVGLGRPRTSPRMPMTSPNSMDVLGGNYGSFGMCGSLEKPKEG
jgi:hypothetical protein